MNQLRQTLLAADIARARARRHAPCPEHGRTKVVCRGCARTFCPRCTPDCPRCELPWRTRGLPKPRTRRVREKPVIPVVILPPVKLVWTKLKPLGAIRIDKHEDSGGWVAVFPYPLEGVQTSGELATKVFDALQGMATTTPFGAGRWTKPEAWYVTFQLTSK